MKQYFFISMMFIVMALAVPGTIYAQDFEVDGIYYNCNGNEASVTHKGEYPYDNTAYTGFVSIPESVTYDGNTYSVTAIDVDAFAWCDMLTGIEIPNSVTTIGAGAFEWCTMLSDICIPSSVNSIGCNAFFFCSELTTISIPNSVTYIGEGVLAYCNKLTNISVGWNNPNYFYVENAIIEKGSNKLIAGCQNTVIPEFVTTISDWAFAGCTELASITIPNSVTYIGNWAFNACFRVDTTSIIIPNSVTYIGDNAFRDCGFLVNVTIPNSVTYIGEEAFSSPIQDVYSYITDLSRPTMGNYVFYSFNSDQSTLHVPAGTLVAYQADTRWSRYFGNIVEMGVTPVVPGDLSGDGVLGVTDVTMLINLIMSSDETTEFPPVADLNGDGKVDVSDITMLINAILSMQ